MERYGRSEEPAVFDTSSLIFLDLLGYMPLLRQVYQVVVAVLPVVEVEAPETSLVQQERPVFDS